MDFAKPDSDKLILVSEMSKNSIPDFSKLPFADSNSSDVVISKLRSAGVLPEKSLVLFLDQTPSMKIEKMIFSINLNYVYMTINNVNNFINFCERFELSCYKSDNTTTVLKFYESSTTKLGLPPKKRFDYYKIELKTKISPEDSLEAVLNMITENQNTETELSEAVCPTEEPSLPEGTSEETEEPSLTEGTSEETSKVEEKIQIEDNNDGKMECLGSYNVCKKRTYTPPLEKIHNTRRSSS